MNRGEGKQIKGKLINITNYNAALAQLDLLQNQKEAVFLKLMD